MFPAKLQGTFIFSLRRKKLLYYNGGKNYLTCCGKPQWKMVENCFPSKKENKKDQNDRFEPTWPLVLPSMKAKTSTCTIRSHFSGAMKCVTMESEPTRILRWKMHCILINSNNLKASEIYSKIQRNLSLFPELKRWWGGGGWLLMLLFLLSRKIYFVKMEKTFGRCRKKSEREKFSRKKKAHSKYHLLKSYDYDIIYSPVFVAIYVANRRKFVLT